MRLKRKEKAGLDGVSTESELPLNEFYLKKRPEEQLDCAQKKNLQAESLGQMSNLPDVIFIPSHDGITPPEPYTAHRLM